MTDDSAAQASAAESNPYIDAALFLLLQVVMWPFVWLWVTLHRFAGDACPDVGAGITCDYALSYAADAGLWIALPVIAGSSFVALVVAQKRRWKRWPVALAGLGLMVLAVYISIQVMLYALRAT